MADKYKLFEADIDVDGVIKKSVELKQEIINQRQELKLLKVTVGENNAEYIKTEAALKKTRAEYNLNQKQVSNLTDTNGNLLTVEQKLTAAYDKEIKTVKNAIANNKELRILRNDIDESTTEGAAAIVKLNEKIDKNTDLITRNSSSLEKLKLNIGNYKEDIKGAFNELNIFNGGLTGFISRANEAGGAGNLVKSSVKGMTQGFIGLTKSTLAFLATPIGAILAALVAVFLLVKNAMNRSEESTNKLTKVFSSFSGIVNKMLSALEPLGEFLIDGIVAGFELAAAAAEKGISIISSGLKLLGFDEAAESVESWYNEMEEGVKQAQELAEAEAKLTTEQRKAQLIQLEYQKSAEKARQVRDDENLTIRERAAANEDLGAILKEQLGEELRIANLALEVANLRIEAEGRTEAALDAQAEALTTIADIQERITGQESEQLTNRVALQKEAADKAREAAEKRIEVQELELEIARARREFEEETVAKVQEFAEREKAILDQKLSDKLISEEQYQLDIINLDNEVKARKLEEEEAELNRIADFEARKKELKDEIELANLEDETEKALLKAEQDYEAQVLELENLQLNEEQKTELLALLETERSQIIEEINQASLDKQLEAYKAFSDAEIAQRMQNAAEVASVASSLTSTLTGLLGDSMGAKLASIAIDAAIQAGLVSINSSAAQATNLAQATAAAPPPLNIPFIATAGVQNAAIKANSTKAISTILTSAALQGFGTIASGIKFRDGGAIEIGGNLHSSGGTKFYGDDGTAFEAEKGEKMFILNRRASAAIAPVLSDINQMHGGVSLSSSSSYLASGGQVLRSSGSSASMSIDYEKLGQYVAEGARTGAMEGSYKGSSEGSSQGTYSGLVDRTENDLIEAGANF